MPCPTSDCTAVILFPHLADARHYRPGAVVQTPPPLPNLDFKIDLSILRANTITHSCPVEPEKVVVKTIQDTKARLFPLATRR